MSRSHAGSKSHLPDFWRNPQHVAVQMVYTADSEETGARREVDGESFQPEDARLVARIVQHSLKNLRGRWRMLPNGDAGRLSFDSMSLAYQQFREFATDVEQPLVIEQRGRHCSQSAGPAAGHFGIVENLS